MAINQKRFKVNKQRAYDRYDFGSAEAFNANRKSDTPDGPITIEQFANRWH